MSIYPHWTENFDRGQVPVPGIKEFCYIDLA